MAGIDNELILSPRLDDLECVYASVDALINSDNKDKLCMCCILIMKKSEVKVYRERILTFY